MIEPPVLTDEQIARRIEGAPRLASLRSINVALSDLVYAENSFTSQIAEIIRRDPSLTSRLLKLVNSVFFGLSHRVNNIEEAIFYLGLRQIRELALATPIIEDFEKLNAGFKNANWRHLWRHSIGTGILTREVMNTAGIHFEDDTDYIAGLVHNVGKIVMASAFPERFTELLEKDSPSAAEELACEKDLIGWNHAQIGAEFLKRHRLGDELVEAVRYHHAPEQTSGTAANLAAGVQLADVMVRSAGIHGLTHVTPETDWRALGGWTVLFGHGAEDQQDHYEATLRATAQRLPKMLKGMV